MPPGTEGRIVDLQRPPVARVRDHITHYEGGQPFFEGETEACINGRVLTVGAYFGEVSEPLLARLSCGLQFDETPPCA